MAFQCKICASVFSSAFAVTMHEDAVHSAHSHFAKGSVSGDQVPSKSRSSTVAANRSVIITVDDVGSASSHFEFLKKVASLYGGDIQETVGGGQCFFDAVRIGLVQLGMSRSIDELRELAGIELTRNASYYERMYHLEGNDQAKTYDAYVDGIWRGREWATEVTICAMAQGLDTPIRVFSSGTDVRGRPMCRVSQYSEGVSGNRAGEITVVLNSVEGHYMGFVSHNRVPTLHSSPTRSVPQPSCSSSMNVGKEGNVQQPSSAAAASSRAPSMGSAANDSPGSSVDAGKGAIGRNKFRCATCSKNCVTKAGLRLHCMNTGHVFDVADDVIKCAVCSNVFRTVDELEKHKVATHVQAPNSVGGSATKNAGGSFKTPGPVVPPTKVQCADCGGWYADLLNHRICSKRRRSKKIRQDENGSDSGATAESGDQESDVSSVTSTPTSASKRSTRRRTRYKHKKGRRVSAVRGQSSESDSQQSVVSDSDAAYDDQPSRVLRTRSVHAGTTRRTELSATLKQRVNELRKEHIKRKAPEQHDPLLHKLSEYHRRLSRHADNILTEKLSCEVLEVVDNHEIVDDIKRPYVWSKESETRLNRLNEQAKGLQTPQAWTWAAEKNSDQYNFNHARMQLAASEELQFVVKECGQCGSTGLLVGIDERNSEFCIDCVKLNSTKESKAKKDMLDAWEAVRPSSSEYPKCVDRDEYLPDLSSADKAVISPVQPIVTVTKNYMQNRKLRQECITLKQEPAPTWVSMS